MAWLKRNKYGNKRTELAGRSFMSKGESNCFLYLTALQKAGEIMELETQVTVRLTEANLRWVIDFKFYDVRSNEWVFADFKGFSPPRWKQLEKLWPFYGPCLLRVYGGRGMRMLVTKEIRPKALYYNNEKEIIPMPSEDEETIAHLRAKIEELTKELEDLKSKLSPTPMSQPVPELPEQVV